jgi:hypothetical protein
MKWFVALAGIGGAAWQRKRIAAMLTKLTGTWIGTPRS